MSRAAPPAAPNSGGDSVPRVTLSFLPVQQHHRSYMQDLCVHLNLHAVSACHLPVAEPDRRRWFKNRVKMIQQSTVYIPLIDTTWIHHDEGAFELYYALRHYILHGSPMVLPVIDSTLQEASEEDTTKIRGTLNDAQLGLLLAIEESCASLSTNDDPKTAAIQVVNLLVELGCKLPETSVATGGRMSTLFAEEYAKHSHHKPNSGALKMLGEITSAKTVSELKMSQMFIADAGGLALSAVLAMLPVLSRVDLSENGLGNKAVMSLCRQLRTHPSVSRLNLWGNEISQAGVAELYFLVCENPRIVELNIGNNPIYSKVWESRIAEQLKLNSARQESQRQLAARAVNAYGVQLSETASLDWMGNNCVKWRVTFMNVEDAASAQGRGEGMAADAHHQVSEQWRREGQKSASSVSGGQGQESQPLIMSVRLDSSFGECKASLTITEGDDITSLPTVISTRGGASASPDNNNNPQVGVHRGRSRPEESTEVTDTVTRGALRTVMASVREFLQRDVALHTLSIQRLNGKHLKFLMEPTDARTERISRETLELCSSLPDFRAALLGEQEKVMASSVRADVVARGDESDQKKAAAAASLLHKVYLRVENNSADPEKSLFIERDITLWRGICTTKSLAQVYRFQIGQYSGNIRDEVSALLDVVHREQQQVGEEDEDDHEGSSSAATRLANVVQQEEAEDGRYDATVSKGVVVTWGKAIK